jgi:hypothetical protein
MQYRREVEVDGRATVVSMSEVILKFARHRCFRVRCVPRRRVPFLRVGHAKRKTDTSNRTNFTGTVLMKNLNRQLLLPVRTTGIPFDRFKNTGESRDHTRDTRDTRITLVTGIPYGMLSGMRVLELPYYVQRKHRYSQHRNHPPPGSPRSSPLPRISIQCMCACLGGRQPIGARAQAPGKIHT